MGNCAASDAAAAPRALRPEPATPTSPTAATPGKRASLQECVVDFDTHFGEEAMSVDLAPPRESVDSPRSLRFGASHGSLMEEGLTTMHSAMSISMSFRRRTCTDVDLLSATSSFGDDDDGGGAAGANVEAFAIHTPEGMPDIVVEVDHTTRWEGAVLPMQDAAYLTVPDHDFRSRLCAADACPDTPESDQSLDFLGCRLDFACLNFNGNARVVDLDAPVSPPPVAGA